MRDHACAICESECGHGTRYLVELFYYGRFERIEICEDCARMLSIGIDQNWDPITVGLNVTRAGERTRMRSWERAADVRRAPDVGGRQQRRCDGCHATHSPYFLKVVARDRRSGEEVPTPYKRNVRYCRDCLDKVLGSLARSFGYQAFVSERAAVR